MHRNQRQMSVGSMHSHKKKFWGISFFYAPSNRGLQRRSCLRCVWAVEKEKEDKQMTWTALRHAIYLLGVHLFLVQTSVYTERQSCITALSAQYWGVGLKLACTVANATWHGAYPYRLAASTLRPQFNIILNKNVQQSHQCAWGASQSLIQATWAFSVRSVISRLLRSSSNICVQERSKLLGLWHGLVETNQQIPALHAVGNCPRRVEVSDEHI